MSVQLFGQLENANGKLVVRVIGQRVGTATAWFHWGGWAMVARGFEPDDGLDKFFPDLLITPPYVTANHVLGLLVDFYTGQLALIEMPAQNHVSSEPRVLAHAQIRL